LLVRKRFFVNNKTKKHYCSVPENTKSIQRRSFVVHRWHVHCPILGISNSRITGSVLHLTKQKKTWMKKKRYIIKSDKPDSELGFW
jgi:hypothetical protein